MLKVIIFCWHCRDFNKHSDSSKPGWQPKEPEFTSFSEAVQHLQEYPDALMDIQIKQLSDND